ncbi:MAG: AAC(3) family N-acetyltransferase [Sedimentisphaerales bacterium]|nr:AAC(3) family N-acetyltransferase [Sedimentisphaerales bacterium]
MFKTISQLEKDLQSTGIRKDGVLLVHSSLRSLGYLPHRAKGVIDNLQKILGPDGTLLLPALSYESVTRDKPYFNVKTTPSCVGALSEYFRSKKGTIRSIHPTHSVCGAGRLAESMLSGHEKDNTPCGPNSPFYQLKECKGQILFIGCGLKPNTSMHGVEELVNPPYLWSEDIEYIITHADGRQTTMTVKSHNFSGYHQRYDRLANVLDDNALKKGKVLDADCYLVEAGSMWEQAYAVMKEDPLYFVEPYPEFSLKGVNHMSSLETVHSFVDAINAIDVDRMAELMTENHTFIDADGSENTGRQDMKNGWRGYFDMIPDFKITIHDSFERDNMVILIGSCTGTFIEQGELKPENHWQVPAAWRVIVENNQVAIWQLFASQEAMVKIYNRIYQSKK